jgi:hypothetical protein
MQKEKIKDPANNNFILRNPIVAYEPLHYNDIPNCGEVYFLNTKNFKLKGAINHDYMDEI